jgi:GTP cyclohydrolase FolE2
MIKVEVESMESIHGYNAFAEKTATLGELKETLEMEKSKKDS